MPIVVQRCPLFQSTAAELGMTPGTRLHAAYLQFLKTKLENPLQPYGASDKSNPTGTPMSAAVPKIRHAHLTQDISVFYTLTGANPAVLRLYAVLTHAGSGTGQPVNVRKQRGVASQMANQEFR